MENISSRVTRARNSFVTFLFLFYFFCLFSGFCILNKTDLECRILDADSKSKKFNNKKVKNKSNLCFLGITLCFSWHFRGVTTRSVGQLLREDRKVFLGLVWIKMVELRLPDNDIRPIKSVPAGFSHTSSQGMNRREPKQKTVSRRKKGCVWYNGSVTYWNIQMLLLKKPSQPGNHCCDNSHTSPRSNFSLCFSITCCIVNMIWGCSERSLHITSGLYLSSSGEKKKSSSSNIA